MRDSRPTDFVEPVEGIGTFTFAKRDMRDTFRIRAEYLRLTEGVPAEEGDWLDIVAHHMAALKVMTVDAPEGWDVDRMDPFDPESYARILAVGSALRGKEMTFRKPGAGVPAGGEGAGADVRPVVPPDVQPGAD